MKAVFPCTGVVVLTKYNVDMIKNFYEGTLIDSQLFASYNQNNCAVQIGKLNYLPRKSKIILDENTHLLTISDLNTVVSQKIASKTVEQSETPNLSQNQELNDNKPLEDIFILNHPFFETLANPEK